MIESISQSIEKIKTQIVSLANGFEALTEKIGHHELHQTSQEVIKHLTDPYLFVIVGEVKSGKSSFINALLQTDKEICRVAPSPMTDTIQQVLYGEENEVIVNQYLKKIYQPVDILKDIAIVDTPGTNTIISHHQEITERFIPAADLIVFVFEAKNPYRESAWQFFDYISDEWWKKVIFVLQQKDLLDAKDLEINKNGVIDQAVKKGLESPLVFCVSAKDELDGKNETSGFLDLRNYIADNILNGRAPILKQQNNLRTLKNIHHKIASGLDVRKDQYIADRAFRDDIKQTLDEQAVKSSKQVDILVENLLAEYQKVTNPRIDEIKSGLGFLAMVSRSFGSAFGMNESPKEWLTSLLQDMETDLNVKLKSKLNEGVIDIADSIQQMGKMVDLKIRNSETILKDDHDIFSDIAEKRANVLKDLQKSFQSFLSETENFYDQELASASESISPNLAAASGITAVGVILAAVTNGMVFDITGGVLTTTGLLIAGVSLGFKRRQILKGFSAEINRGKAKFNSEVRDSLKAYIQRIKERIDNNFAKFDHHLKEEGAGITVFTNQLKQLFAQIEELERDIESQLS